MKHSSWSYWLAVDGSAQRVAAWGTPLEATTCAEAGGLESDTFAAPRAGSAEAEILVPPAPTAAPADARELPARTRRAERSAPSETALAAAAEEDWAPETAVEASAARSLKVPSPVAVGEKNLTAGTLVMPGAPDPPTIVV